jgi:hypothetical protein
MFSENDILIVLNEYLLVQSSGQIEPDVRITPIKTGLIHQSFRIETPEVDWLLQQVNTGVFRDLIGLMRNIELVTDKLTDVFGGSQYETLELIKTKQGTTYTVLDNVAWRMYGFKSELKGFNSPNSPQMVIEAGKAFAAFTEALSDINPNQIAVTIPQFHSLKNRFEQFLSAKSNPKVSLSEISHLIDQTEYHFHQLVKLEDEIQSGKIPLRITHNDAKFNNLLFDSQGLARCVVDLDTIMPGIIHFDIGDSLRTLVPNITEDSPDIHLLELNHSYERAFLSGYLEVADSWITETERNLLPLSGPYMALIMGMRFLTDHLNGNIYFSCDYPEHNLTRARNQLTLCEFWE